jgi:hypothetical protein
MADERRTGHLQLVADVAVLKDRVEKLHDALLGNGQPGLLQQLDTRVSSLEHFKVWVQGVGAAIGGVFAIAMTALGMRK